MQIQVRDALGDLTSDEIKEAVRLLRAERGLAELVRFARVRTPMSSRKNYPDAPGRGDRPPRLRCPV